MPSTNTPDQNPISPSHEDFHWIHGPGKTERFADFIALTRDMGAGIHTSMQLIYASQLRCEVNQDGDPEEMSAPSIGKTDSATLFRFAMAAAALLRNAADGHIDALNKPRDA